jgi:hypothetical protein
VVGGFRYAANTHLVGSLLLGLYNNEGKLDHVGFTASLHDLDREALTRQLEGLIMPPGFTGNTPGGAQPVEHRTLRRVAALASRIGGRSSLRSRQRRTVPPRHPFFALATGQSAGPMHPRADRAGSGYGATAGGSRRGRRLSPIAT